MVLGLFEEFYNTSSISVLSFHYFIQFGNRCIIFYITLIHLLWFHNWQKIPKLFLGQDFFHFVRPSGKVLVWPYLPLFQTVNDPQECSLNSHPLGLLFVLLLTLLAGSATTPSSAGSSAWGMAAGCRNKISCLSCYSCSEPVLLVFLCFQLNTKVDSYS